MKAKNILMTLLLVTGAIAAKAAGYPPELALVSQPVMVYNANSITVYYDVENIGDRTYRGSVYLFLSPDDGRCYADKWVRVRPGRIKRVSITIPAYRIHKDRLFTIMPYYELGDELYSFTTFEYFDPINFYWDGPRNDYWVVYKVGPRIRHYHRPGDYRFYYDGFRPPMPPPGYGHATPPPPMDPMHHTYGYHKEHGGYPAHHFDDDNGHGSDHNSDTPSHNHSAATVKPNNTAGSMSSRSSNSGSNTAGSSSSNGSGNKVSRPSNNGSNSGTSRPSSNSSNVSRPSSNSSGNNSRPSGTSSSSSERKGTSSVSRSSSSSSSSSGARSSSSSSNRKSTSSNSNNRSSNSSSSSSSSSRGSSSGSGRR